MQPFAEDDHHYRIRMRREEREICGGVEQVYGWARNTRGAGRLRYDLLLEPESAARQSAMAATPGRLLRQLEALRMLTSGNARLFRLAGERDPYRDAPFGVIAPARGPTCCWWRESARGPVAARRPGHKHLDVIVKGRRRSQETRCDAVPSPGPGVRR